MSEQQVIKAGEDRPAQDSATSMMTVIERVAMSENPDMSVLERMMDMQERWMNRNAKQSFHAAMAEMQQEIPEVVERAKAHNTKYASFEDINSAVRPVLHKYGFAVTFRVEQEEKGLVRVIAVLSHKEGHSEDTSMILPYDTSGSKNAVQAVGSTVSYGKRYTMSALLNIATRGEDDDASGAVAVKRVNDFQASTIRVAAMKASRDMQSWLKNTYGAAEKVPADEYNWIVEELKKSAGNNGNE